MGNQWNGHNVYSDTFINRPPSARQGEVYDAVTALFVRAGEELTRLLPPSRFASLALTALEEASMWAKKCVAFEVDKPLVNVLEEGHAFSGDNIKPGPCSICGKPWAEHGILPRSMTDE